MSMHPKYPLDQYSNESLREMRRRLKALAKSTEWRSEAYRAKLDCDNITSELTARRAREGRSVDKLPDPTIC